MNNVTEHYSKKISIDKEDIFVDAELAEIILKLNEIGFKTSGCCIGNKTIKDYAWIKIQEIKEYKIVNLMKNFSNCEYVIDKELYYQNNTLYVDYILKTPVTDYSRRVDIVNKWADSLSEFEPYNIAYKIKPIRDLFK